MRGVSQISPPIRILLVVAVGLIAAWMFVLKPKDEPVAPSTPAPNTQTGEAAVSDPGKVAEAAQGAVAATNAKTQATEELSGGETAKSGGAATAAAPTTAEEALATGRVLALSPLGDDSVKNLPKDVRKALARRDVIAIGIFNTHQKPWAEMPADDRAVRRALRHSNHYRGRVTTHMATLKDLPKLRPVIGDLDVAQTPSVVIVDRNRQANVIQGYVDRISINQAIADARRDTIAVRIKSPYLAKLNKTCGNYFLRIDRFAFPRPNRPAVKRALGRLGRLAVGYERRFAALKAPARFKGLKSQVVSAVRTDRKHLAALTAAYKRNDPAGAAKVINGIDLTAAIALDKRLDRLGVAGCVGHRRS
jgi:hypothetical protein